MPKTISNMAAPAARTGKRTGKRLADLPSNQKNTQQQAVAPTPDKPKAAPKARRMARPAEGTAPAGSRNGRGRQQQPAGADVIGKQGESTAGKSHDENELRGGAKQVLIADATLPTRSGRRRLAEDYPFEQLSEMPSKLVDGKISGPSFFIPNSDRADGKVTVARKRYGGLWITRRTTEQVNGEGEPVTGLRVWRGSPELEGYAKR